MQKSPQNDAYTLAKDQEANLIRWIRALLSNDYKQGNTYLFNPETDRYCVNGVALKEFGVPYLHPIRLGPFQFFSGGFYVGSKRGRLAVFLDVCFGPRYICTPKIAPFDWFKQVFGPDINSAKLGVMNDLGVSFTELAKVLIRSLPESNEKTELSKQVAERLRSDSIVGQNIHRGVV